jgi:hypothetical protein
LVSLMLMDSYSWAGSRLCYTLRNLQHLTHVELHYDSVWCHPSNFMDPINDNLPDSIESLFITEGDLPDKLPTDDSTPEGDSRFDVACVKDPFLDYNFCKCQCRTRDIRRLLLDERLTRLREVTFSGQFNSARPGRDPNLFHENDPHVLRHIWTPAVRRRGWKLLQRPTNPGITTTHTKTEAVLYRELTDGVEDVATMSGC